VRDISRPRDVWAKGKGESLGESMKPLPSKHKLVFKFFLSSHFPRANLEAVDIHLPYTYTFIFFLLLSSDF